MNATTHLPEEQKHKTVLTPNVDKDTENLYHEYIAGQDRMLSTTLENR